MNDVAMSDSTASGPSHSLGKEVDRTYMQEGPLSLQDIDDSPFQTQPNASNTTQEAPCKLSDPKNESSLKSRPESDKLAVSSFSPADWTKTPTPSVSAVEGPSSSRVPSTIPPSGSQSYTLPPLSEGTVAALRKEVLVDPYPFPLESAGLGDGNNLVLPVGGVVGASIEAAKRMPSPESQCEENNVDDIYDSNNPGEQSMPEVCDTQLPEPTRSRSPSASPTPQPMTRQVEKETESSPINPTRADSTSTDSSLTSLSTSAASSVEESSTPRAPSTKQIQYSTPVATLTHPLIYPASQTSNITEDEVTVMDLVMDALPTSPAPAPLSKTTFSPVLGSASTLVLVSPEPGRTRPINSPRNDDPADKENLTKLQEWYREQRMKVLSVQETEDNSITTRKDDGGPEKADSIPNPGSPVTSPKGHSTNQTDNVSGNDHITMSPLFTEPSVTPPKPEGKVVSERPEPLSSLKKLVEIVKDDDVDIVPLKRKCKPSVKVGPEKGKEKPIPSLTQQPPKGSLLTTQNKRQPSKAKTRIKKRKISQEPTRIEIDPEDEEEDQPPLKRVKLRLDKTPASKVATSAKPKSVTIVSPVKTPMRRVRDHQPRTASVAWPKLDNPVFDQVGKKIDLL